MKLINITLFILLNLLFSSFVFAQTTFDKGIALYEKGDYSNAIKVLEKDDDNISSLYYLGLAYEKNNEKKQAEDAYKRSVEKGVKLVADQIRKNSKVGEEDHRQKIKEKYGKDIDNAFLAFGRYGLLNKEIYSSIDWRDKFQILGIYSQNILDEDRFYFDNETTSKLKITSKTFAGYTTEARRKGITGSIKLLVSFMKDGSIGMVFPLNTLDGGLTEHAINAAKQIQFKPAEKDGKPVNTIKLMQYDFRMY